MVAFHGKQEVKDFYLNRVREHRKMNQLRQSFGYWQRDRDGGFRGCAVGCTLHSSNHAAYESELGIPRVLARLEDGIFEGLPSDRAQAWPEEFLSAATAGADLSLVWPQFAVWLMADPKWGVMNFAKNEKSKTAIIAVADLYRAEIAGVEVGAKQAVAAAYVAAAAYADAAAAADADRKYIETRLAARLAQADKLLELMAVAPVPVVA